ncbi:MAG: wax ester/triacylglycerol synthase family O-acyltransferase [Acidimicrobiia bacterium]|nr:wax ester/triacylglycerol synthase family O-acyltransferase [Acidimicrobiia bacterium]
MDDGLDIIFEARMSDADALMWRIEKDPLLRSTIVMVMVFDHAPPRDRLTRRMERVTRQVPRLRQRVLGHPLSIAPPRWEVDPNFDLHYHLRWMRVPGPGTLRDVFEIAEPIAMQGFDRARPLWEFTIVEGLEDGGAALIGKVHHSITDGVGGVKLQMELLDLEAEPGTEPDLPPAPTARSLTEAARWRDALWWESERQARSALDVAASAASNLGRLTNDPVGVGTSALRTLDSVARVLRPAVEPMSPLMRDRSLSVHLDSLTVPLDDLKRASKLVSGKLNDAFVAAVTGGLRRYHEHHGQPVEQLRMTMPINVRTERSAHLAGNRFAPARFGVPVGTEDPIRRMNDIRELVERYRAEPALGLTEPLANLLNRLPATATTALFGSMLKGIDFVTSNVPGPPIPVYVCGARMLRQYAFGPMTGAATNIVLLSCESDVNVGITMDPAAIPDGDTFVECLQEGFDEVLALV